MKIFSSREKNWYRLVSCVMLLLLIVSMAMAGCSPNEPDVTEEPEQELRVSDYFPVMENVKYVYEGSGNEFAGYTVYNEYISGGMVQQRVENAGTVAVRVFNVEDDKVTHLFSKGEVYYRENMLAQRDEEEEILLMEPLEKGNSWTSKDGSAMTITGIDTEVETPVGTFSCIEVVTENNEYTTIDYYAKDRGLVKTIFQSGGEEVTSTLSSFEDTDVFRTEKIRFYYPDVEDEQEQIQYLEKEVTWHTNNDTAKILEDAYKEAAEEISGVVLPEEATIKSLSLDQEGSVRLDFNAALVTEMNAGSGIEMMILQSIANTFGGYYNASEVILTIEGKPYESGHVVMEQDEPIIVDLDESTENE